MIKNAYIHIPFCRSKCKYCSFISYDRLELTEAYLNALKRQIQAEYKGNPELQSKHNSFYDGGIVTPPYVSDSNRALIATRDEKLNTLYFGGGTPSLLTIDEFSCILRLFNLEDYAEITFEVNPESVDGNYLSDLFKLGVNRLSIGAQTFNDEILKLIGRRHNAEQIQFALRCARNVGFKNINLDLIYGLPKQTLNDFKNDLYKAIGLNIEHISLYGLKLEKGCYFYDNPPFELCADADMQADMYLSAVEILKNSGFEHYEISNFSKQGFPSRHNLNYWNNNTYYGFGCSASGYGKFVGHTCPTYKRYTNQSDLEKYIQNHFKKDVEHELSQEEILEEAIFLGFRKVAGINIADINQKFGVDFNQKYAKIMYKYSDYFVKTQTGWALTLDGMLISNEILSEFIC